MQEGEGEPQDMDTLFLKETLHPTTMMLGLLQQCVPQQHVVKTFLKFTTKPPKFSMTCSGELFEDFNRVATKGLHLFSQISASSCIRAATRIAIVLHHGAEGVSSSRT